jgi:phosphinothricin acetyltransferase
MACRESSVSAIIIRESRDDDVAAIAAIYGHHVRTGLASFEYEPPTQAEMARRRAEILAKGYPYLAAELNGVLIGYSYASAYRPRPGYRFTVEDSVYVHPDWTGKGAGRALLPALIARCEALGYRQMVAVIGDSANAPSIRLHEAFGFAHAGLLKSIGWKLGRWVDSVIMQRALGEGDASPPPDGG